MCMGFSGKVESPPPPPPVQQQAPQVTPPTTAPESNASSQPSTDSMRRRAMSAMGVGRNIATSPLGIGTQAITTNSSGIGGVGGIVGNLLG